MIGIVCLSLRNDPAQVVKRLHQTDNAILLKEFDAILVMTTLILSFSDAILVVATLTLSIALIFYCYEF